MDDTPMTSHERAGADRAGRRRGVPRLGALRRRLPVLGRYAATSVVSTVFSETVVVSLYASHVLPASAAAVVATVSGAVPAYVMSRYWIWPGADRHRPVRQAVRFWALAFAALGAASLATGVASRYAPRGARAHDLYVAAAYIGTYALLWAFRFVVSERAIFVAARAPAPAAAATAVTARAGQEVSGPAATSMLEQRPGSAAGGSRRATG